MPAIVNSFIQNKHYGGTLKLQKQILLDYEEDITKYAGGLDKGKILASLVTTAPLAAVFTEKTCEPSSLPIEKDFPLLNALS